MNTALAGKTVLVVDDNKDAADILALALRHLGCVTSVAYDGLSGLSAFAEKLPDLVFLDIGMPDMSGYDVAREIRQRESDGAVLVAVTGYGQDEDKRRAMEAGFDYHVTKPLRLRSIQQILSDHT